MVLELGTFHRNLEFSDYRTDDQRFDCVIQRIVWKFWCSDNHFHCIDTRYHDAFDSQTEQANEENDSPATEN